MPIAQGRRHFLTNVAFAGAAAFSGAAPTWFGAARNSMAAEPPPETSTVRFAKHPALCEAPLLAAQELLRAEGFTDFRYIGVYPSKASVSMIADGELDFAFQYATSPIIAIDTGAPLTLLGGVHIGCFELFAREDIHSAAALKGRTVGTQALGSTIELVTLMASYVGLDPSKDIRWVTNPTVRPMQLFIDGQIDAFLAIPPEPQKLRARNIGHVIVNSAIDRPWSQYFCCMLIGNAEFVRKYPVATQRVLRAVLKTTDLCASQPQEVARLMAARGFADDYDYAMQMLNEIPYGLWRDYDPEDTVRWYALRLHEAGLIKSSPQEIIRQGANWRFLNEVKHQLKI